MIQEEASELDTSASWTVLLGDLLSSQLLACPPIVGFIAFLGLKLIMFFGCSNGSVRLTDILGSILTPPHLLQASDLVLEKPFIVSGF